MPDFSHYLQQNADEVKEQPVLPIGQYLATVGQYKFDNAKTKDGDKPVIKVPILLRSRLSGEGLLPPKLPELTHTFWLTNSDGQQDEYTLNPIKAFCQAVGIDTSGRSIGECLAETVNQSIAVDIGHRPNPKNPDRPYADMKGFASA